MRAIGSRRQYSTAGLSGHERKVEGQWSAATERQRFKLTTTVYIITHFTGSKTNIHIVDSQLRLVIVHGFT